VQSQPFDRSVARQTPSVLRVDEIFFTPPLDDRSSPAHIVGMTDTRTHILATGRRLTAERGYTAVGLAELLKTASVPKGSFYHYFASKEEYGCALLKAFVHNYKGELGHTLDNSALDARARLLAYFARWQQNQTSPQPEDRCLVVKLSAEIADLSPAMRTILQQGVAAIVDRLAEVLKAGVADGSIAPLRDSRGLAVTLYQIWLGASLMASLSRDAEPFRIAMERTRLMVAER
jgi:TetR/AcrR family transcriptional regulator, transcriptional repressor for nem operon